jgi:Flp pilus assembly protein TadD
MSDVEAAANTLIDMQPKEAVGYVMLGVSLARQGQLGAAEARLRRGLELDPEHLGAWGNLAKLLRLQGRTREAKEAEGRIKALRAGLPPTR